MHLLRPLDKASIKQSETIELTRTCITSSARVTNDSTFVELMKALVSYTGALYLEYGVMYVDECMKDILYETMSSE